MTGAEFKRIREKIGVSAEDFAEYLGYSTKRAKLRIDDIELGRMPVPRHLEKLMRAYDEGYRPKGGFK